MTGIPLYHYTCTHHHQGIQAAGGILYPARDLANTRAKMLALRGDRRAWQTCQVIWLTSLPAVVWLNRTSVGLTNHALLDCDRTRYRYRITSGPAAIAWPVVREVWPGHLVEELESLPGARPDTWWVSRGPLQAVYDPHQKELAA